jgi:HD-like signal output (HDOD) protein
MSSVPARIGVNGRSRKQHQVRFESSREPQGTGTPSGRIVDVVARRGRLREISMLGWFRRPHKDSIATTGSNGASGRARSPRAVSGEADRPSGERGSVSNGAPASEPAAPPAARAPFTEAIAQRIIADRLHALLGQLPDVLRRTDAPVVLGALADSVDTAIGQPPAAAQRALNVSRNPNSSVSALAELFANDPGLAQGLLHYANSGYYAGLGDSCVSLASAVQRIGSTGVENVLLASTVRGVLCRPGGPYDALVEQVWSHMVRSGPIARDLASAWDVEPERAFALALLHDAGKLILFERVSAFRKRHRREVNIPNHVLLWALKRLHEPMGGLAALHWGLPEDSARAISRHHRDPVPADRDPLSEVIFLAENLDLDALRGTPPDLDGLWKRGSLTGDLAEVRSSLAEPGQAAA